MNPVTWKMNWGGVPELFAGFVEFIAMCMVSLVSKKRLKDSLSNALNVEIPLKLI